MSTPVVWIVDDDRSIRWVLERALAQAGWETRSFENAADVLERAGRETPDVIVSDIRMPGMDGLDLLSRLKELHADVPVIIMTAHSDLDAAVASYQRGAFEYLPKPFDVDDAVAVVQRAVLLAEERRALVEPGPRQPEPAIIGKASAMQEVFRAIGRLSHSHVTVLINGESGTGKELVARALHRHSPRAGGAFIALNMAAIPRELIESELFGHEKGAFTGAAQQRIGRFEQADGGTLFLDEIGDMPAEAQTRLLRVLAESEFHRVGGSQPIRTDVRIIAATHQDLESLVSSGRFREDLFHRLNVIRVHLPPLRDRRSDVGLLARHFLAQAAVELGEAPKVLRPETDAFLSQLPWPGNVRQLENTCRWLTVMAAGREIHVSDLPPELRAAASSAAKAGGDASGNAWEEALRAWADVELAVHREGVAPLLDRALPRFEQIMIERALAHTGGRRREASIVLGWGRNTLTRKIKELGLRFAPGDDGDDEGGDDGDRH